MLLFMFWEHRTFEAEWNTWSGWNFITIIRLLCIFLLFTCLINSHSWYLLSGHKHANSLQLCPTLCDTMDCSSLDSCVHGILQARTLKWVAMLSFRGSFQSRDWAHLTSLMSPVLAGGFFTTSATWEGHQLLSLYLMHLSYFSLFLINLYFSFFLSLFPFHSPILLLFSLPLNTYQIPHISGTVLALWL